MTTTKIVLGHLISRAGLHVMPEAFGEIKKFLDELFASRYDIDFLFYVAHSVRFGEDADGFYLSSTDSYVKYYIPGLTILGDPICGQIITCK